ncbi:MAG: SMP-30/gluconolactonase/LRE family protein [Nitrospirae bacterium]|nr:SMP-30/gluconolactonase/LRE family protein [Nitrospirota bacterium]
MSATVLSGCGGGDSEEAEISLPVAARPLIEGVFKSSEGIAFDSKGRLLVTADKALWEIKPEGTTNKIVSLKGPIGIAHDGSGSILVAESGDTFGGPEPRAKDGAVLRVSEEGAVSTLTTDIPDPNFILVRKDGSLLVSDDMGDVIYSVPKDGGTASVFLKGLAAPNGMVFSLDASELFVAQSFSEAGSLAPDSRVWRVPMASSDSPGAPALLAKLPDLATNDGLAMDEKGRVYVAANIIGKIYRIDPKSPDPVVVASGIQGVASLAFGRGKGFSETSLFVTQLFGGGVYELPLGVKSASIP